MDERLQLVLQRVPLAVLDGCKLVPSISRVSNAKVERFHRQEIQHVKTALQVFINPVLVKEDVDHAMQVHGVIKPVVRHQKIANSAVKEPTLQLRVLLL